MKKLSYSLYMQFFYGLFYARALWKKMETSNILRLVIFLAFFLTFSFVSIKAIETAPIYDGQWHLLNSMIILLKSILFTLVGVTCFYLIEFHMCDTTQTQEFKSEWSNREIQLQAQFLVIENKIKISKHKLSPHQTLKHRQVL